MGSLAIAATSEGWLTGEPAPPKVVEGFRQYTPQLGFHPESGKAQFVAQDGAIKLYATANREGGICYLVDEPWKPANAGDGGTCASREKAAVAISAGLLGASQETWVIGGRVADSGALSVTFTTPAGESIVRPLGAGGFYVAAVQVHLDIDPVVTPHGMRCPPRSDWEPTFVALGADEHPLTRSKILLMRSEKCAAAAEGTPHGPYR